MTTAERQALRQVVALSAPAGRRIAVVLALASASILAGVTLLGVSGALISKAALRPPVLSLSVLIVSVRALALVRALARYGERLTAHDLALGSLATLRTAFFARLAAQPAAAARGRRQSELLSRFVADVDRLQDLYLRALTPWGVAALCAGTATLAAAVVLPVGAAVLGAGLLVGALAVPWAGARMGAAAARRQAAARATLTAEILESTRHGAELVVLGQAGDRAARLQAADARLATLARRDALALSLTAAAGQLVQGATIVGVLLAAIGPTADGRLDGILLAALVLVTLGTFEAVTPLPASALALAGCAAAAQRIDEVAPAPAPDADAADAAAGRPARPLPAGRELLVDGLTVRGDGDGPPVLDGLALRLAAGERVALVGPSGAGKTTLAEVLVRRRDADAGRVLLGGVAVRDLDVHALRRRVRLLAQDAGLFTTSIAANVRLARPDATDGEVRAALEALDLGGWLDTLPEGIDTLVGEDGATVSGGQRRRIALARALVADAGVLLVDEPTAHLDAGTAQRVMDALTVHAREQGQSLLAIVHPGVDLRGFDRVLELRGGVLGEPAAQPSSSPLSRA